jgi:hypothetical protein
VAVGFLDRWSGIKYIARYYMRSPMPVRGGFSPLDFLMIGTYKLVPIGTHIYEDRHYIDLWASLTAAPFVWEFLASIGADVTPFTGPVMPLSYARSFTANGPMGSQKFTAQYVRIVKYTTSTDPTDWDAGIQIPY